MRERQLGTRQARPCRRCCIAVILTKFLGGAMDGCRFNTNARCDSDLLATHDEHPQHNERGTGKLQRRNGLT